MLCSLSLTYMLSKPASEISLLNIGVRVKQDNKVWPKYLFENC